MITIVVLFGFLALVSCDDSRCNNMGYTCFEPYQNHCPNDNLVGLCGGGVNRRCCTNSGSSPSGGSLLDKIPNPFSGGSGDSNKCGILNWSGTCDTPGEVCGAPGRCRAPSTEPDNNECSLGNWNGICADPNKECSFPGRCTDRETSTPANNNPPPVNNNPGGVQQPQAYVPPANNPPPVNNQPVNNQPVNNQPVNNQPVNNQPVNNQPVNGNPNKVDPYQPYQDPALVNQVAPNGGWEQQQLPNLNGEPTVYVAPSDEGSNVGLIVGAVGGGICCLCLLIAAAFFVVSQAGPEREERGQPHGHEMHVNQQQNTFVSARNQAFSGNTLSSDYPSGATVDIPAHCAITLSNDYPSAAPTGGLSSDYPSSGATQQPLGADYPSGGTMSMQPGYSVAADQSNVAW